jgi:Radical SAM superfamily
MPQPSTFCVLPWIHLFADEAGVMWPCCRSVSTAEPNRDDVSGEPRRVDDPAGLRSGMDTKYMRRLRLDMLDGKRPAACERCFMVEDLGIRSHRQDQNDVWVDLIPQLIADTPADGAFRSELRTADIRLGNRCNLRCRMCSPQSSKALIPEWAKFHGISPTHPLLEPYRSIDWFERPEFWASMEFEAPNLGRINFAGGEPFMIGQMFEFLEAMISAGRASEILISYNTNMTLLPPRLLGLWPRFRGIRVTASLDGAREVNDYIRSPSRWADIEKHIKYLDSHMASLNLSGGLGTNSAIQVLNIFSLGDLLDFLLTELQNNDCPNLSIVTHPEHLNVRVLPSDLKAVAAEYLAGVSQKLRDGWPGTHFAPACQEELATEIDGIVRHMTSADHSHRLPALRRWTAMMDVTRKENVRTSIPQLASLFP